MGYFPSLCSTQCFIVDGRGESHIFPHIQQYKVLSFSLKHPVLHLGRKRRESSTPPYLKARGVSFYSRAPTSGEKVTCSPKLRRTRYSPSLCSTQYSSWKEGERVTCSYVLRSMGEFHFTMDHPVLHHGRKKNHKFLILESTGYFP